MSRSTQRLDGLATDQSGSTGHCDSHDRTFFVRISNVVKRVSLHWKV
jgi:hypothetical protein